MYQFKGLKIRFKHNIVSTMGKIKFGTGGWEAIIADDFTVEGVKRIAFATALWLKKNFKNPSAVVGADTRFAGPLFADTTTKVLASQSIKVFRAQNEFVSTPMVSLGIVKLCASAGVIITASHKPPNYNGYHIKTHYGGPATFTDIEQIQTFIPDIIDLQLKTIEDYKKDGLIEFVDLETIYVDQVEKHFDIEAIKNCGFNWAYDAMYGAGQNVMRRILPDITFLHCEHNPGFDGQAPEPSHLNLTEFSEVIKISEGDITCGLATDGDADWHGLYDENGNFVDLQCIMLLLIHYTYKIKGLRGEVYSAFSCSKKIQQLCNLYGINNTVTKIGSNYSSDLIAKSGKQYLIGAQDAGGIAITGHIPEGDGIWIGFTIWEFMAKTNRTLTSLIKEIYQLVGLFMYESIDIQITEELKQRIIAKLKAGSYKSFASYTVTSTEDLDGYKFHFDENSWVMVRMWETEPLLRIYAEAATSAEIYKIFEAVKVELLE